MGAKDPRYQKLTGPARRADAQKQRVLEDGGYAPIPHPIYREILAKLVKEYKGATARDALTLYMYLHSYVNGTATNDWYMWAFPTVEQIRKDTGIHQDRIRSLSQILEAEGLLITTFIPWQGNRKKMYLPLYYADEVGK
ncbi:helix-turn-helix domain-containing protein [Brevibacillus laterosporus]|uniref:helix-turn-helix domain-containing protein n=1 Tax=Brevibacillus laterosporus TaxID=1465 RepID=UPI002E1CCCC6